MDFGGADVCDGDEPPPPPPPPLPRPVKSAVRLRVGEEEEDEEVDETTSLLFPKANGGTGRSSRRKVQWNDRIGNKLVQVLEFQPSDSSDSENEDGDSCFCSIM